MTTSRIPSPYGPQNPTAGTNAPAQTEWFGSPPIARASDPATSKVAAKLIEPRRGTQMREVLYLVRAYPAGLTPKEIERYLMKPGIWKRASDLKAAGWLVPTGEVRDGGEVLKAVKTAP